MTKSTIHCDWCNQVISTKIVPVKLKTEGVVISINSHDKTFFRNNLSGCLDFCNISCARSYVRAAVEKHL